MEQLKQNNEMRREALQRYKRYQKQQKAIKDAEVLHHHATAALLARRGKLENDIHALHPDEPSAEVPNAAVEPEQGAPAQPLADGSAADPTTTVSAAPGTTDAPKDDPAAAPPKPPPTEEELAMQAELTKIVEELTAQEEAYFAKISDLQADAVVLSPNDILIARSVEAYKSLCAERETATVFGKKKSKGKLIKQTPEELFQALASFSRDHQNTAMEALPTEEVPRLDALFRSIDVNETGAIEGRDLESMFRKIFSDRGISALEVEWLMLKLGYEPFEPVDLNKKAFMQLLPKIVEVLEQVRESNVAAAALDNTARKARNDVAQKDLEEKTALELKYTQRVESLKKQTSRAWTVVQQEIEDAGKQRRLDRLAWAAKAIIHTSAVEDTRRRLKTSPPRARPSPSFRAAKLVAALLPHRAKVSTPPVLTEPLAPVRKPRPPPTAVLNADMAEASFTLATATESVLIDSPLYRESLRRCLERAPLTGTLEGLTEAQVAGLRELFIALTANTGNMGDAHMTSLFAMFTGGEGCDPNEGADFMDQYEMPEFLTFEEFIEHGPVIITRAKEPVVFKNMTFQEKLNQIIAKEDEDIPLAQYEISYLRQREALRIAHEEALEKQAMMQFTSGFKTTEPTRPRTSETVATSRTQGDDDEMPVGEGELEDNSDDEDHGEAGGKKNETRPSTRETAKGVPQPPSHPHTASTSRPAPRQPVRGHSGHHHWAARQGSPQHPRPRRPPPKPEALQLNPPRLRPPQPPGREETVRKLFREQNDELIRALWIKHFAPRPKVTRSPFPHL